MPQENNDAFGGSGDPLRDYPEAFLFQERSQYTLAYRQEQDALLTDAEARREIVSDLKNVNVAVNIAPVTKEQLHQVFGDLPDFFVNAAKISGLVWVWAYCDGTLNTGAIVAGKPVVVDTVTGKCVTGIHQTWGQDEYKIVGIAWKSHSSGFAKIPIRLQAKLDEDVLGQVSAHFSIRSLGPPIIGTVTHRPAGMTILPEETVTGTIELENDWGLNLEEGLVGAASYVTDADGSETFYLIDRLVCVTTIVTGGS